MILHLLNQLTSVLTIVDYLGWKLWPQVRLQSQLAPVPVSSPVNFIDSRKI
jgi:hypothetical protein